MDILDINNLHDVSAGVDDSQDTETGDISDSINSESVVSNPFESADELSADLNS